MQAERLVGTAELEHLVGVSRQRIFQLKSGPDFPAPITALRGGEIWDLAAIRSWAARVGRTLNELPTPWPPASSSGDQVGKYRRS